MLAFAALIAAINSASLEAVNVAACDMPLPAKPAKANATPPSARAEPRALLRGVLAFSATATLAPSAAFHTVL
ncbi:MAG TPA: hypothetical protein VLG41_04025 [Hydrogenophaga sp.]|nr:hypothetical protein [Hydrogenophaga sp.]HSX92065.1 hypothetical protein [Hydrogenophaga sp.]